MGNDKLTTWSIVYFSSFESVLLTRSRETIIVPVTMARPLSTPILTITPTRKSMLSPFRAYKRSRLTVLPW